MTTKGAIYQAPTPDQPIIKSDGTPTDYFWRFMDYVWTQTGGAKPGLSLLDAKQTDALTAQDAKQTDALTAQDAKQTAAISGLFKTKNTDDLQEGTGNLYYEDERVDDRVAAFLQAVTNAGILFVYDDNANVLHVAFDFTKSYHWLAQQTFDCFATKYIAKTANYTVSATDFTIDCTTGTFTVTLPTAVGIQGRQHVIKNSGTGVITVATTSAQTIDGASTLSLSMQWQSVTLQSTGSNWIIL